MGTRGSSWSGATRSTWLLFTFVLQKLFGFIRAKSDEADLQVHNDGKAVVSAGTREKAELDVARLHAYGLWATMTQDA